LDKKMADQVQYYGTGRRKSSVARVFLRPGSGKFIVNDRELAKYFLTEAQRVELRQPLVTSETTSTFDITANVSGGGINGQAGALRMGIARALLEFNVELRKKLKAEGFLRRDARGKERKKYGQKGARKRFQFSKR
jgi:small subunit ribosomal protein S9